MQHRLELLPQPGIGPHHIEIQGAPLPRSWRAPGNATPNRSVSSQQKPPSHARHPGGLQSQGPISPQAPSKPAGPRAKAPELRHPDEPAAATPGPALSTKTAHSRPHQRERPGPPVMGPIRWNCAQTSATRQTGGTHRRRGVRPQSQRPAAGRHQGQRAPAPPGDAAAGRLTTTRQQQGARAKTTPSPLATSGHQADTDKYPCRHENVTSGSFFGFHQDSLKRMMACDHTKLEMS